MVYIRKAPVDKKRRAVLRTQRADAYHSQNVEAQERVLKLRSARTAPMRANIRASRAEAHKAATQAAQDQFRRKQRRKAQRAQEKAKVKDHKRAPGRLV